MDCLVGDVDNKGVGNGHQLAVHHVRCVGSVIPSSPSGIFRERSCGLEENNVRQHQVGIRVTTPLSSSMVMVVVVTRGDVAGVSRTSTASHRGRDSCLMF